METHGYKSPYVRVPQGHCWIEGDHRANSLDSNVFGPVAVGLIKSKAKCIVWPPHRWQMLNQKVPLKSSSTSNNSINSVDEKNSDKENYPKNLASG